MSDRVSIAAQFAGLLFGILGPAGCRDHEESWLDDSCIVRDRQSVDPITWPRP